MYLEYYGLLKEPFHITPDPEFLYLSPSHKEALGVILFGVENRAGFMMITGGVGLGKTTVLRSAMQQFDRERVKTVLVFNPCLTYRELIRLIYEELGLEVPDGEDQFQLIQRLHLALIEEYKKGNNVVLVIDEAQNMPVETLENLRMLSNLETSKDKLLQIILVGQQPELEDLLNSDTLRQLKQRIAHRATLVKLSKKESVDYIGHRLDIALGVKALPFTTSAINKIVSHCDGVPRCINIICSNALVSGFGSGQNPIGPKMVQEVIDDLEGRTRSSWKRWIFAPVAVALTAAFLYLFLTGRMPPWKGGFPWSGASTKQPAEAISSPGKVQQETAATLNAQTTRTAPKVERVEAGESSSSPAKPPVPGSTPAAKEPVAAPSIGDPPKPSGTPAPRTAAGEGPVEKPAPRPPETETKVSSKAPAPPGSAPPPPKPAEPPVPPPATVVSQETKASLGSGPTAEPVASVPPAPASVPQTRQEPSAKAPESPKPERAAASDNVKSPSTGKSGSPEPDAIIDWLIDKRTKQKGSSAN
jgi:general secretion pathway protein A